MAIQNMNNWQQTMRTLSDSAIFLFNNKTMSDITFVFPSNNSTTETMQIHAHSWILSMVSPVFYESFKENFEVLKQIPLSESSYEAFLECLRFIYKSECVLTHAMVFEVMKIAQKYFLNFLEGDCAEYIMKYVSVESICPTLDNAITLEQNILKDKLIAFIAPNFSAVLKTNSFPNIKKKSLEAILNIEHAGPVSEMEIFEGVMNWGAQKCNADQMVVNGSNKRLQLGELVKKIRFPTMTSAELGQCLAQEEGLLTVEEGYSLLLSTARTVNEANKHGFGNVKRTLLFDLNLKILKEIYFNNFLNEYITHPNNWDIRSKFTVNKIIYITGLYVAKSKTTTDVTIQFFNDKKIMLFEETFNVIECSYEEHQLRIPLFINSNQEYTVDVKVENDWYYYYVEKITVPFTKTKEEVEFSFSQFSNFLMGFTFKSLD